MKWKKTGEKFWKKKHLEKTFPGGKKILKKKVFEKILKKVFSGKKFSKTFLKKNSEKTFPREKFWKKILKKFFPGKKIFQKEILPFKMVPESECFEDESNHEDSCSEEESMSEDETPTTSDEEFIVSDEEEEDEVEDLIEENENLKKENEVLKNELKKQSEIIWKFLGNWKKVKFWSNLPLEYKCFWNIYILDYRVIKYSDASETIFVWNIPTRRELSLRDTYERKVSQTFGWINSVLLSLEQTWQSWGIL